MEPVKLTAKQREALAQEIMRPLLRVEKGRKPMKPPKPLPMPPYITSARG